VAATVNGLLYAIGGDSAGTVEVYDPATNTWAAKAARPSHKGGGAAGVIDGLIYVVGGFGPTTSSKIVEVYNPATDAWVVLASMQTGRDEAALAAIDGRLFVAGGKTGSDPATRVATLERFRPPETSWWSGNESVAPSIRRRQRRAVHSLPWGR
jgi:N-acetylneuraminic acid mutarotase